MQTMPRCLRWGLDVNPGRHGRDHRLMNTCATPTSGLWIKQVSNFPMLTASNITRMADTDAASLRVAAG